LIAASFVEGVEANLAALRSDGFWGWLLSSFQYEKLFDADIKELTSGRHFTVLSEAAARSSLQAWLPTSFAITAPMDFLALLPNLIRLVFGLAFFAGYVLRPFVERPVLLLWARVIESDKPVFTIVLGGIAAAVAFVQAALKHFHLLA
jgi:hypothetical protein